MPFYGDVDAKFEQQSTTDIAEAAVLSELLGKPVKAIGAPVSEAKAGLLAAGMPPSIAGLYAEMYES